MKYTTYFLKPQYLRCEYTVNPMGISESTPRFSWVGKCSQKGQGQSAYRLIIASSKENIENYVGDIWDSGKVVSSSQNGVRYKGEALVVTKQYWWKVRIWDYNDRLSDWSETAVFETGYFDISDWPSKWISIGNSKSVVHARSEFWIDPSKTIAKARAYVASTTGAFENVSMRMNTYEFRLNGEKVGKDIVSPGQISDKNWRALYRCYDITDLLILGNNALGILFLSKGLSVYVSVEFTDGSTIEVCSDCRWRMKDSGPFKLWYEGIDEHGGKTETYDARKEYVGWDRPHYDDACWEKACETFTPGVLQAQLQTVEVMDTLVPIAIKAIGGGKHIVDFGQNIHGHIRIEATGKRGTEISIRHAENLDAEGRLDPISSMNLGNQGETDAQTDCYIMKGEGVEVYAPRFANHGFRYVEVSGYPGEISADNIRASVVHSTVLDDNYFICSNEFINKLQHISVWSFKTNMVSVPTDCPHRERNGWLGDDLDVSEAECLNFDALTFYENWFVNLVEDQEENGHVPCISPFHSKSILKLVDIPWSAAVVLIPWDLYQAYGDQKILTDNYQIMKKFIEFMGSVSDHDHIITSGVTWNDHISSDKPSNEYIGSVYYYRCIKLMSLISKELGEDKDAAFYEALSEEIRDSINRRFLVQGKYYEEGTQSANAHALFFEIVPEEYKSAVMENLVNDLIKKEGLTTGCHGTYSLVPALAQNGGNDLVYNLATQTTLGAWGYWISECNATTALEHWDGNRTHSYNHPFLIGSLSAWFYRQLGGIRMEAPGYSKIQIKPYIPNDLTYAKAKVNTPRGILSSEWKKEEGMLYMNVTIPFNSVAAVYIPCIALSELRESGEMGDEGRPIECIGYEEGYAKLILGSGEYCFTSRL